MMDNRKGQTLIIGIMIMVMAVIIFIATLPALASIMNEARSCDSLNCAGYVDKDASAAACGSTNGTYTSTLDSNDLSCTILDLGIPYLVLGVLVGLVAKLIHGNLVDTPQPPQYQQYGGY